MVRPAVLRADLLSIIIMQLHVHIIVLDTVPITVQDIVLITAQDIVLGIAAERDMVMHLYMVMVAQEDMHQTVQQSP